MTTPPRLVVSIEAIKQWMISHGAPLLAENLADGATEEDLNKVEEQLGFALPSDLRDLWTIHNGQHQDQNGFVGFLDLFDCYQAAGELDHLQLSVEFLREMPDGWAEAGVQSFEIQSDHWLPFAGRDSDLIVVSAVSGRVFRCEKDSPPLKLVASSVVDWAENYAAQVLAGDYAVEEGFGDYHLALRDRNTERLEQEKAEKASCAARYRQETSLLEQLRDALSKKDSYRCQEVFEDLLQDGSQADIQGAFDLLFDASPSAEFIAASLRVVLNKISLQPSRWAIVAKGGKRLGNHAIVAVASAHVVNAKPWWKFWTA